MYTVDMEKDRNNRVGKVRWMLGSVGEKRRTLDIIKSRNRNWLEHYGKHELM